MPRSSQMPELPHPVPISTTDRAPIAVARKSSTAPASGSTGVVPPISSALARAISSASSSTTYSTSSGLMTCPLHRESLAVSLVNITARVEHQANLIR